MAQSFKETAHLRTDPEKFSEGWNRIFGKKETDELENDLKNNQESKDKEKKDEQNTNN